MFRYGIVTLFVIAHDYKILRMDISIQYCLIGGQQPFIRLLSYTVRLDTLGSIYRTNSEVCFLTFQVRDPAGRCSESGTNCDNESSAEYGFGAGYLTSEIITCIYSFYLLTLHYIFLYNTTMFHTNNIIVLTGRWPPAALEWTSYMPGDQRQRLST